MGDLPAVLAVITMTWMTAGVPHTDVWEVSNCKHFTVFLWGNRLMRMQSAGLISAGHITCTEGDEVIHEWNIRVWIEGQ